VLKYQAFQRHKTYQDFHDIFDGDLEKSHNLIKGWLRGIYDDTSIPVIKIISQNAFIRLFLYDNLKSLAPIPESISIVGVFQDELELFKKSWHTVP
jgi:hypothetical protein